MSTLKKHSQITQNENTKSQEVGSLIPQPLGWSAIEITTKAGAEASAAPVTTNAVITKYTDLSVILGGIPVLCTFEQECPQQMYINLCGERALTHTHSCIYLCIFYGLHWGAVYICPTIQPTAHPAQVFNDSMANTLVGWLDTNKHPPLQNRLRFRS